MRVKRNLVVLLMVFCLTCAMFVPGVFGTAAFSEDYDAATMRLLRYEGTIRIYDAAGEPRFIMENARFNNGEAMETDTASTASVSLDNTKIVTLDEESRVAFAQEDSHLRLTLEEGTMLLDVQKKLGENETLNIETSTMTVGIRGTIVFVSTEPQDGGPATVDRLGVLEGTAQLSFQEESGVKRVLDVPAGQVATLRSTDENGIDITVAEMTKEDIQGFVEEQIAASPEMKRRVELPDLPFTPEPAENMYPADGDWHYDGVTLVAQSASKLYDGHPLTRTSDILVYSLPADFSIRVAAGGSQIDAGTSQNPISTYTIYNSAGEDVTSHFSVETVSGTLTVEAAPLTVWTGSAEKTYDGTPLTNEEAGVRNLPKPVSASQEWRNTSLVFDTVSGSEAMLAISGEIYVHATNPLTGESIEMTLFAGQKLSVRLHNAEGRESIEFVVENMVEEDIPDAALRLLQDNPDLLAQSCEDTGWDPDLLAQRIAALPERDAAHVSVRGLQVDSDFQDAVMWDGADVRMTVDTDITNYNSHALGSAEAHFTPIYTPSSVEVTATGSQTEPGTSDNTYTLMWGAANPSNYIVSEELGTLTVLPSNAEPVILTAASAEKTYDGTPLSYSVFYVYGLPQGFTVRAIVNGSLTDAGTADNVISGYWILNAAGENVTAQFTNVQTVRGTLTVYPAPLTVTTGSAEKVYDGTDLSNSEARISGLVNGETASVAATGRIMKAGSAKNGYTIKWGTAKASNYSLTEKTGTLTVQPLGLLLDIGGSEIDYTGQAFVPEVVLTYSNGAHAGETVSGVRTEAGGMLFAARALSVEQRYNFSLFTGEDLDLSVSGMGTDAGTYTLSGSISFPSADASCFSVSFTGETLTVLPGQLTVTTGSASKMYDGVPLTVSEATVTGAAAGDTISVTATGSLTDVGTADNTYTIDWGEANADNYLVTEALGTLTVTANDSAITLTAPSVDKPYDGTALTADTITVDGLPEGFTVQAVTSSLTDAGTCENEILSYSILDASGQDVTAFFTNVSTVNGTLTVLPASLTITTGSASKQYDGTALTDSEVTVTGAAEGEVISVTANGSLTDVGTAVNSYAIEWGSVIPGNYIITESLGTLEISVNTSLITITSGTSDMPYRGGRTLENHDFSVDGLPDGFETTVDITGMQWEVGESDNTIAGYAILKDGKDVTPYFTNVMLVEGKLTVKKGTVRVWTEDVSKTYDGTPLSSSTVRWTGIYGTDNAQNGISVYCTGSITDAGSVKDELGYTWIYANLADMYDVVLEPGTLTVLPAELTITTGSASKEYDGTPLTNSEATVTEAAAGDTISVTATGSLTNAGTADNTYTIDWGSANPSNYSIKEDLGTLTVLKRQMSVISDSSSKDYDGQPLTCDTYGVYRLVEGETIAVNFTGQQTDIGSSENTFTIDWLTANPNNYSVRLEYGTLTVVGSGKGSSPLGKMPSGVPSDETGLPKDSAGNGVKSLPVSGTTAEAADDAQESGEDEPKADASDLPAVSDEESAADLPPAAESAAPDVGNGNSGGDQPAADGSDPAAAGEEKPAETPAVSEVSAPEAGSNEQTAADPPAAAGYDPPAVDETPVEDPPADEAADPSV